MATTGNGDPGGSMQYATTPPAQEGKQRLIQDKLAAFQELEAEFLACFHFIQKVQGQERLPDFPVSQSVRFLHALWVCECKDALLSVPVNQRRYEGRLCLELLGRWQDGETAGVVAFLQRKLDNLDGTVLTAEIGQAQAAGDVALARRLAHGRRVMLNRAFHLVLALDAIFMPSDEQLTKEVSRVCRDLGHTPDQIASQLAEMESRLYAYVPHPLLARRNMLLMNEQGIAVASAPADLPGHRTDRVQVPILPQPPYAELAVAGEMTLVSSIPPV